MSNPRTPWKTGCVIFDDPKMHEGGWAAMCDHEGNVSAPFRINGTGMLSSDVVWWFNMEYQDMSLAGLLSNTRFRCDSYLRLKMSSIFLEWGLPPESDPDRKCILGATILWRVSLYLFLHFGFDRLPLDFMKNGIRDCWPPDPVLPRDIREALLDAVTEYTSCERTEASLAQAERRTFLIPRFYHAKGILATPVPGADWHPVSPKEIPRGRIDESAREWLIGSGRPVLVKARVTDIDPERNAILGFGSGARKRATKGDSVSGRRSREPDRSWLTLDEAIVLSQYATVTCENVIAADPEKMQTISRLTPSWPSEDVGAHEVLSWSYGMFMENLWTARTAIPPNRKDIMISGWNVFYRSYDHMLTMSSAWTLSKHGIIVLGYGLGRIMAAVPAGMGEGEVAGIAHAAGVYPDRMKEPVNVAVGQSASNFEKFLAYLIKGSSDPKRETYHLADEKCLRKHWDKYGDARIEDMERRKNGR